MKNFETVYVALPEPPESTLKEINDKITDVVKKHNGKIQKVDNWGTKKLGYHIGNHSKGNYVCVTYTAQGTVVPELQRTLQLREDILRQLTISLGKEE